ncbi:MAG: DnaJ domain-containing protein [Ekhidna sp.]
MTHYEILELAQHCHASEIKKAYRNQVKKYHPDINPDPSSADRMIKINEAYEVLSDVATRDLYDQFLAGVPVKTIIEEATPEQRYRAEYIRNKTKKKREQMEFQVKFKQKFYRYYRFVNMFFFVFGVILNIDYFYQPDERKVELDFMGRGQHSTNIITVDRLRIAVDRSFYNEYGDRKSDAIFISYSSVFKKPARVRVDGAFESHIIQRTFYSFRNVFSAMILIFSTFVVMHRKYSDFRLSCGLVTSVCILYVLLFIYLKM